MDEPGPIVGITGHPSRKSKYLYIQQGSVVRTVARFYREDEAQEFLELLVGMALRGAKIEAGE